MDILFPILGFQMQNCFFCHFDGGLADLVKLSVWVESLKLGSIYSLAILNSSNIHFKAPFVCVDIHPIVKRTIRGHRTCIHLDPGNHPRAKPMFLLHNLQQKSKKGDVFELVESGFLPYVSPSQGSGFRFLDLGSPCQNSEFNPLSQKTTKAHFYSSKKLSADCDHIRLTYFAPEITKFSASGAMRPLQ